MKDTKEYIIQKAFELFLQKSYKEVTMKDIVTSTGLSKGAFYHYFESKEAVFEEVVRFFYNKILITDFSTFPTSSLKAFYRAYIEKLQAPSDLSDELGESESNLFIFISEASRKIPHFNEIHTAQRQKEINAWSKAVNRAKKNNEIFSTIPDKEIANLFIYLSDGISLSSIAHKPNEETLSEMIAAWDNLYNLLTKK